LRKRIFAGLSGHGAPLFEKGGKSRLQKEMALSSAKKPLAILAETPAESRTGLSRKREGRYFPAQARSAPKSPPDNQSPEPSVSRHDGGSLIPLHCAESDF